MTDKIIEVHDFSLIAYGIENTHRRNNPSQREARRALNTMVGRTITLQPQQYL
jgi:hypothetical protein